MSDDTNYTRDEKIAGLIEQISAYIEQYHHGSIELLDIHGNTVRVRMGGACEACALLPATLRGWVAGTIHQFFPDMEVVAELETPGQAN